MTPFFVPPKTSTSTPARQVMSAALHPRVTSAFAKRAPSMCTGNPTDAIARTSSGVYTVPASVACVMLTHDDVVRSRSAHRRACSFPSAPGIGISFAPPVKNSGAPSSSR